jgi:hypothetical protein
LLALLATLAACASPPAPTPPPGNTRAPSPSHVPADLGSLAIVTAPARSDAVPGYVPISTTHPLVDPARRMPPNTPVHAIDARGAAGTFTSGEPTKIPFGCDGNQLGVTPLAGRAPLAPGIAWIQFDVAARPKALALSVARKTADTALYVLGDLRIRVERDAQRLDRGILRVLASDQEVGASGFARTLMDGADPSMATLDLAEGGPGIPTPLGGWSIDGSGHLPYLLAIERPGWEGTTIEAWLVERGSLKQIEAMSVYLYQCAF